MDKTSPLDPGGAELQTCDLIAFGAGGREVPVALWWPAGETGASRGLVLVGHGGSQHKRAPAVIDVAETYARHHGFAVAAIDGPVHGARRTDWGAPTKPAGATVISDFRALWRSDPQIEEMIEDWRAALTVIERTLGCTANPIGWHGLSMGTAYGLPLCAAEPRIRAAVLGKWGTTHPHGDRLLDAARQTDAAILFQMMLEDEIFSREGQLTLFDAIRSRRKRLAGYPGRHGDPDEDQFNDAARFLVQQLAGP